MKKISKDIFKKLYKPPKDSHKGQNGRLTIIGGSHLFHGASLWALKTASRIVDMVFYSTVKENEELTRKLKSEIYDFICVSRDKVGDYIRESDAVLIGPGLMREEYTTKITKDLLFKFPQKKWVIDAGSLQMMDKGWLKQLTNVVITPHQKELEDLFGIKLKAPRPRRGDLSSTRQGREAEGGQSSNVKTTTQKLKVLAREYDCVIVLKGKTDIVCSSRECALNETGNEGMTKGGTGDVLAGLMSALACKNDLFLSACAGVYINGIAGDRLYKKVGPYFNASDLCEEIPVVMKELWRY